MGNVHVHRAEGSFSMFGCLGGDFCKDTCKAKLFGMHIGSVLSGLHAGNVNADAKISIVGYGDVWRGVKSDDFSIFGDILWDFCKETYEPKMFGMHIRSVLSGLYAENVNTDQNIDLNYV